MVIDSLLFYFLKAYGEYQNSGTADIMAVPAEAVFLFVF